MKKTAYIRAVKAHPPTFTWCYLLVLVLLVPFLNACGDKPVDYHNEKYYVGKAKFTKGRPCVETLFKCLPESQDKSWQEQKPNKDNSIDFFELTPEVMTKYKETVAKWNKIYEEKSMAHYVIDEKDDAWIKEVERKQFLKEMEVSLEKEFPSFWRDVPYPVRYRWIRRAMSKGEKYGYTYHKHRGKIQIIELCARIGLDFDLDPKWEAITKFISMPKGGLRGYAGEAVEYIDFTIFEKNQSLGGDQITDWSMRTSLQYLPYPKRKLSSLND